jgi:hypothetical protein
MRCSELRTPPAQSVVSRARFRTASSNMSPWSGTRLRGARSGRTPTARATLDIHQRTRGCASPCCPFRPVPDCGFEGRLGRPLGLGRASCGAAIRAGECAVPLGGAVSRLASAPRGLVGRTARSWDRRRPRLSVPMGPILCATPRTTATGRAEMLGWAPALDPTYQCAERIRGSQRHSESHDIQSRRTCLRRPAIPHRTRRLARA